MVFGERVLHCRYDAPAEERAGVDSRHARDARVHDVQVDRRSETDGFVEPGLRRSATVTFAGRFGMNDQGADGLTGMGLRRAGGQSAAASSSAGSNRMIGPPGITVEMECL